jgi:pimeloyl-ACP methyl ester carboxylesterase
MKIARLALGWFFSALFTLLLFSMVLLGNWPHAAVLLVVVLLFLPPVSAYTKKRLGRPLHPAFRLAMIVVLLLVFGRLLVGSPATSIYGSPEIKARFAAMYDAKMADWPVPHDDVFVGTDYGTVHVVASGARDAPAMLLLHASGVSSWSWKYNVEALSREHRTYAIDLIGDAGRSEYASLDDVMRTGRDQADLYAAIMDSLGIEQAFVVGASEGGFIASNLALHYPERVRRMALLGPMGYAGATRTVARIMFAQFFPLPAVQRSTFRWAFGDDPELTRDFRDWFLLLMNSCVPAKVAPLPLSAEERQAIRVPVLFVLGQRDNLVGDPQAAIRLVRDMPDARVEVVDAGHLMGAEAPDRVNQLMEDFFAEG